MLRTIRTFNMPVLHNFPMQVESHIAINPKLLFKWAYFGVLLFTLLPLSYKIGPIFIYTPDVAFVPFLALNLAVFFVKQRSYRLQLNRLDQLILLFVLLLTALQIFSAHPLNSLDKITTWWRFALLYFMTRSYLRLKIIDHNILISWWIYFGLFLLSLGLLQLITHSDIGMVANYFGQNLEQTSVYGVLKIQRVSGTTDNSNIFGQWLVLFSLLLNTKVLFCNYYHLKIKLWGLLVFFMQPIVIMATLSRGTILFWISANAILFCFWIFKSNKYFMFKVFFLIFMLVSLLLGLIKTYHNIEYLNTLATRMESQSDNSDENRLDMIINGFNALSQIKVQLAGTGLGAFYPYLFKNRIYEGTSMWRYDKECSDSIHNVFFLMAVEGGLVVFAIFLCIVLYSWRQCYQLWKKLKGTPYKYLGIYFFIITTSFIVPMQVYNSTISYQILFFLAVQLALVNSFHQKLRVCSFQPTVPVIP